jgi:hypothetical protein
MLASLDWIAQFFLNGVLVGIFTMGTLVLQPVSLRLAAEAHIMLRQQMISRLHYLAPPLMVGALISMIVGYLFFSSGWSSVLLALNVILLSSILGITLLGNVPLNRRFMTWQPKLPPENWITFVRKWELYDQIRFVLCLASFVIALAAHKLGGVI